MIRWTKKLAAATSVAVLALLLGGSSARAILHGDCGNDGVVFIGDVQQCVNIFLQPALLPNCPNCDQAADGAVDIGDVQGAASCFLNPMSPACLMVTPVPTPTPPLVATATPTLTPTSTTPPSPTSTAPPTATHTPVPPSTSTFTPSNTPLPTATPTTPAPTSTATATTPPATPTATPTLGEPGAPDFEVTGAVLGGGGVAVQCPNRVCTSGPRQGQPCTGAAACRVCVGGSNMGMTCSTNAQCPGSTCSPATTCLGTCDGGSYNGLPCASALECLGCNPNDVCTANGVPLPCCTGNNTGTCPVAGSCAIVQNPLFAVRLGLNGICVPRQAPETLAEVSCVKSEQCPAGKTCQASSFTLQGFDNGDGTYRLRIPRESLFLPPAVVSGIGTVCVVAGGDGTGILDCAGGTANINLTATADHNTNPPFTCLGGTRKGLPCTTTSDCTGAQAPCPQTYQCAGGSSVNQPCTPDTVECPSGQCVAGPMRCTGGTNAGLVCTGAAQCPGGSCGPGPDICSGGSSDGQQCTRDTTQCPGSTCNPVQPRCIGGFNNGQPCTPGGTDCPALAPCNNEVGGTGNGGGLPDDPTCSDAFTSPAGVVDFACEEGTRQCNGGPNAGRVCTSDADCPGSTCGGQCNGQSPHPGVCNSPTVVQQGGIFAPGDMLIVMPLAISILATPAQFGDDGLACTADDRPPSPPATVPIALSTGLQTIQVFDGANGRGTLDIRPGAMCGTSPCVSQIDGQGVLCNQIVNQRSLSGMVLGGGFPALDTTAGDIATTFQFVVP